MDYKKDIQQMGMVSQKNSSGTSPVRGREDSQRGPSSNGVVSFGVTLSKKCERLATAIYLVTNFLSDTEPMKSRLRALSIEIVRDASFVKNGTQGVETNVLERLHANIFETLSLLEIAFIAGLVSEMNFTILKREYASLRDIIEVKKTSRESRTDDILGNNFFSTPNLEHQRSDLNNLGPRSELESAGSRPGRYVSASNTPASPKGHSIGQTTTTMSDSSPRSDLKKFGPKVGPLYASVPTHRAITDVAKEGRRARILKLIKDNREVSIKDIVAHFPDLSEKTIQRELVAMSDSGVLKKSGERRWSRYAIV